jgi:hypothetical protein
MVPATDTRAPHDHRIERLRTATAARVADEEDVVAVDRGETPPPFAVDWSNPAQLRALVRLLTGSLEELMCSVLEPPADPAAA